MTPEERNAVIGQCASIARQLFNRAATGDEIADAIETLKSQPATPDKRDGALREAKVFLENLTTYDVRPANIWKHFYVSVTGDFVNLREVKEQAKPFLDAIDEVLEGRE